MTVTAVVAMGANRAIGVNGGLPWHLPEDLAHFKKITLGHPMVMGRTTFDAIGRPLPGRHTIVVTRNSDWQADGVEVRHSLEDALASATALDDEVFLVGGGQLYAEALDRDLVDVLVITRVAASPEADTYFPPIDWDRWTTVGSVPYGGDPSFEIVTYQRQ